MSDDRIAGDRLGAGFRAGASTPVPPERPPTTCAYCGNDLKPDGPRRCGLCGHDPADAAAAPLSPPTDPAASILRRLLAEGMVWCERDDGSQIAAFEHTGATLVVPLGDDETALFRELCEDDLHVAPLDRLRPVTDPAASPVEPEEADEMVCADAGEARTLLKSLYGGEAAEAIEHLRAEVLRLQDERDEALAMLKDVWGSSNLGLRGDAPGKLILWKYCVYSGGELWNWDRGKRERLRELLAAASGVAEPTGDETGEEER